MGAPPFFLSRDPGSPVRRLGVCRESPFVRRWGWPGEGEDDGELNVSFTVPINTSPTPLDALGGKC